MLLHHLLKDRRTLHRHGHTPQDMLHRTSSAAKIAAIAAAAAIAVATDIAVAVIADVVAVVSIAVTIEAAASRQQ